MIETHQATFAGRNSGSENFPVASKLLPAWARAHVFTFYRFARAADDVADAPGLTKQDKLDRLQSMDAQLRSGAVEPFAQVLALSRSLEETGIATQHGEDLLKAFLWDAGHPRTQSWAALMAYCDLSAAPVGRYLIDLLGGIDGDDYTSSDALCAALQVLNHLQDIKDDVVHLDRVYLPGDWLAAEGVADGDLRAACCTPELRRVLDRMLDGVDELLRVAKPLPGMIRSKSLACEAGGIYAIATALAKALRTRDPLAERVELGKFNMAMRFMWGAFRAARPGRVVYP